MRAPDGVVEHLLAQQLLDVVEKHQRLTGHFARFAPLEHLPADGRENGVVDPGELTGDQPRQRVPGVGAGVLAQGRLEVVVDLLLEAPEPGAQRGRLVVAVLFAMLAVTVGTRVYRTAGA